MDTSQKRFSKLSTKAKLFLGFGFIILAFLSTVIVSYLSISAINNSQSELTNALMIERELTQFRSDENRLRALMLEMILSKDGRERDTLQKEIKERVTDVDNRVKMIKQGLAGWQEEQLLFKEIETLMITFRENRVKQLELIRLGKNDSAMAYATKVQSPLYDDIRQRILTVENELDIYTKKIMERNNSTSRIVLIAIIIMGIGTVIIAILLILWMLRMLSKISMEIRNGVTVLGTSAAEILSSVTEISTGATETSTAISETTTTVEEVRQTAVVSNQKAVALAESSQKATDSVEKGQESVQQVIEAMKKIDSQMNIIADTVVKLADQNRSVGEITSSVTDIADQSNLLAVNAAIEAAKAGEHGRGFAVVAQEIRSLAEQSKKATAQVKEIINEIQKSVSLAVDVTGKGSRTVEDGIRLVKQSGEVIEILAENVDEAAQSFIQISSSSQQQMAGMEQIVPAMENIKQASEQNVSGIKQTQIAAHNLNELGQKLKEVIERFNL
jgi:methyl-accepting chemotaxis protein